MSKIQQSTLCYNLNHQSNIYVTKKHTMEYRPSILAKIENKNTQIYYSTITSFQSNTKRHIDKAH